MIFDFKTTENEKRVKNMENWIASRSLSEKGKPRGSIVKLVGAIHTSLSGVCQLKKRWEIYIYRVVFLTAPPLKVQKS